MAGLRYPEIDQPVVSDTGRTFQDVKKDEAPPFSLPSSQFYSMLNRHLVRVKKGIFWLREGTCCPGLSLNPGNSCDLSQAKEQ